MSFALEEALEADWVAVRPNVFEEKEKHKFVFIVAWNEIEGKFAITCHNRTAQRQRSATREGRSRTPEPGGSDPTAAAAAGSSAKGKAEFRSPPRRTSAPKSSSGDRGGEPLIGSPGSRVEAARGITVWPKTSLGSPTRNAGKERGRAGVEPPARAPRAATEEPEVLDVAQEEEAELLDIDAQEECSWAGLFSFHDLKAVHQQLCAVNCELEPCLPVFPEEPLGVWTVLFGPPELSDLELDSLCCQLQFYLGHALDTCGWKILSQVLFTESDDPEEYYESLSELRQKGYEEVLQRARKHLQELLEKHKNTESMVELLELYQMEDDAYGNLAEATTELYQYLLQPFRDMRELAMLRRQQIKISLENDYLGPRRIESLKKEDADWQKKAQMAVLSIQDLTVKYFEITAKAQKAVSDRMRMDQKKYGKASWTAAVERMEKLQYAVSKETLQLMRAKEICLDQKKHALKEEMQSLQGGTEAIALLNQLEADYYGLQLQLYEVQFEILKFEELLLTAQLESIRRQISEKREEVVYYDTYESMEAMLATEEMAASIHLQREELQKLEQKVRQLEARRGRISAKKAYLRNKKEICIAKHTEKIQQHLQGDEEYRIHHAVQLKREQLLEEELRKSTWVSQERQKTLDRLRTFKQRHPGQVILKSTRLRLAHSRRKSTLGLISCGDQPHSLPATVQKQEKTEDDLGEVLQHLEAKESRSLGKLDDISLPPKVITSELSHTASLPLLSSDGLEQDAVTVVYAPPPPPPPPPPPLPTKEESSDSFEKIIDSPIEKENKDPRVPKSASAPSSYRFDSSQLVSARKKLKKTGALEGLQRRRVSSPMDEVLASLKRGSFHLRKVEQRTLPPFPDEDDSNNILAQIRKGVKLKKVQKEVLRESFTLLPDTDPLTRSIHEALRRIKEASPESEDEDENLPCTEWEN
uniref:Junction-mediating and -regulatory protein n=1 Tax=Geotrypetes seraphini TaxID=260995 RepID=A0A6P8P840_GEOSA|nr:junction-mediating and -regulatory protein [Geotrypetes seraphini]XP_033785427.1 junction-mediating and -regulatory protein [Geotrypetes seraphini]